MVFQFISYYLQHRFTAKTRHGTHSPFVYKLIDEVIYDFSAKKVYEPIELQRKKLLNDHSVIIVNDFTTSTPLKKKVSRLAKITLISPRLAQLIYRLAKNSDAKTIVEIGNNLGISTAYLAAAKPLANVISLQNCPQTANLAHQNFKTLNLQNVTLKVGSYANLVLAITTQQQTLDFVFINTKNAILNYFNYCLPKVDPNTLLIFNNIYGNKETKTAWQEIKAHPKVTLTIDLFWIGLVYFKTGQAKQHFKIRF